MEKKGKQSFNDMLNAFLKDHRAGSLIITKDQRGITVVPCDNTSALLAIRHETLIRIPPYANN
jgi:hypothetical protein